MLRENEGRGATGIGVVAGLKPVGPTANFSKFRNTDTAPRQRAKSILVIDDDSGLRHLYRRFFEPLGYRVFHAADGRSGLETARIERPAVVLLDITLPGMDGIRVYRRLKEDPLTAATRVVFITDLTVPESLLDAAAEGLHVGKVHSKGLPLQVLKSRVDAELSGFTDFIVDDVGRLVSLPRARPVRLPARRFLFFIELLACPEGVSFERLHHAIWAGLGDKTKVHVTAQRLRRDLSSLPGFHIETIVSGYRLVVKPVR